MSLKTPYGILQFPNLFVAKPVVDGGKPRYSCIIAFDKKTMESEAYKALKTEALRVANEQWGAANIPKSLRSPFRENSEKEGEPFDSNPEGVFISPWSYNKPGIVGPDLTEILTPDEIWAGQLVRASVSAFAYDQGANRGVNFLINNIQIVDPNRVRLDSRVSATKDFDAVSVTASASSDDVF